MCSNGGSAWASDDLEAYCNALHILIKEDHTVTRFHSKNVYVWCTILVWGRRTCRRKYLLWGVIATSCKYKSLTVITEDPAQGIYHTAIADAALSVAQYMAASYSAVNATFAGRAWRPISMQNGSAAAFAPIYGSEALLSYTNASGMFRTYGSAIYILNADRLS